MKKNKMHDAPKDAKLHEAYYKRYGVYFTKDSFARIKRVANQITLTLREISSTLRNKEK